MSVGGPETLTILFTDLVGSTALASRLGDEPAQALRRAHDRILRQQFSRFSGEVVKGTGDGFLVAFSSARAGVECAVAIQREIAAQQAEGRYGELAVRAGLHTGEPVRESGDLFGSDVNLAARIEAEAKGGEVLVSEATRLLALRQVPFTFEPAGERLLKGFDAPVVVYSVRWPTGPVRSLRTRFVGRADEAACLRVHLDAAMRGSGGVVLVGGDPGVGKTRMVSELAVAAEDRGARVLTARAYDQESAPPYQAFAGPLAEYAAGDQAALMHAAGPDAAAVAQLVPGFRKVLQIADAPPAVESEADRYRVFESVTETLLRIAVAQPLMLFLDDLQWADSGSLLLLRHVARRAARGRLLIVGTYRRQEVSGEHALTMVISDLQRERPGSVLALDPLGARETADMIAAALGRTPDPRAAQMILDKAAGNPFFTEELLRHFREQGTDLSEAGVAVSMAVPDTVRYVISRRLTSVGESTKRLLTASSVIGRELSLSKVAAVAEAEEEALLDALDEALAADLVREEGDGFAFAHPLIQETLYEGLSAPRRRLLHRRAAETLERRYADEIESHVPELAFHFHQAAPGGDAQKAVSYSRRAGEQARAMGAFEDAAGHYERALQACDLAAMPDERLRGDLLLALGFVLSSGGNVEQALEAFRGAAELGRRLNVPELLGHAALAFDITVLVGAAPEADELEAVELLDEALNALPENDSTVRALILSQYGRPMISTIARARAPDRASELLIERARAGVAMAERIGDAEAIARARWGLHSALWHPRYAEERVTIARNSAEGHERTGSWTNAHVARVWLFTDYMELGRIAEADAEMERIEETGLRLRGPEGWYGHAHRAMKATFEGRLDDADRYVLEALTYSQTAGLQLGIRLFALQMYALRREQGRLAEIEPLARLAVSSFDAIGTAILADLYSETGRREDARQAFETMAEGDFAAVAEGVGWFVVVVLLAEACAYLGDARRAETLYGWLAPHSRLNLTVVPGFVSAGSVARPAGRLAALLGRWQDAERLFEEALAMNRAMGARPAVARTQRDYAAMLLTRGERARAEELLTEALAAARGMGMAGVAKDCEALMAGAGAAGG